MRLAVALVALVAVTWDRAAGAADAGDERPWSIAANAYAYFIPEESDFVMAVVPADVRLLHVEARYNYEAIRSGSAFVGVNVGVRWGEGFKLALTPMFGGVAGELDGVIPALRFTVTWWKLELTSESEVVIDLDDNGDSFFYNWSELGIAPVDWLHTGVVIQRNRELHTPLDVQRGLFVAGTFRSATLTLYELNLFWTTPTWIVALSVAF
jgi:hypothetical protein